MTDVGTSDLASLKAKAAAGIANASSIPQLVCGLPLDPGAESPPLVARCLHWSSHLQQPKRHSLQQQEPRILEVQLRAQQLRLVVQQLQLLMHGTANVLVNE